MNKKLIVAGASAVWLAAGQGASAQDAGFVWEGEVEIGIDSTIDADDPAAELTDTYVSAEVAFEAAITDRLSAFGGLTLESVLDPTGDRAFEDLGLYVGELGLRYAFGETTVSAGKISPVFAIAWDEAPGFYGTSLAEDYELSEMIGVSVDTALGNGTLSAAVFYVDDTGLSNSIGTKRGRTTVADGGAANTGKLNNIALQYSQEFGETTAWIGARHLSAGQGDASDETGLVAGFSHSFANGIDVIGEVAHFNGFGGSTSDATYLTAGAAYEWDAWTFSAAATLVDHSNADSDSMISFGVDRAISDNVDLTFGIARFDVGGEKSTAVGLAAVIAF